MNKRAVMVTRNKPLEIESKPIHEAPPTGVVIKTHYCGICHSDVHVWEEEDPQEYAAAQDKYVILGHEVSGEVFAIGDQIDTASIGLAVGDRVALFQWRGCRSCSVCQAGYEEFCNEGGTLQEHDQNREGGFQEYIVVFDIRDIVRVPENISMTTAALLTCSGLTAYNALTKIKDVIQTFNKIHGRSTLLVVGAGGVAQMAMRLARVIFGGTVRIVCADVSDEKVAMGIQAGADDVLVWPREATCEDLIAKTKRVLSGGIHATLDFVNVPKTVGCAFAATVKGGILAQIGLFGGTCDTIRLQDLTMQRVTILGVKTGTLSQLRELFQLMSHEKISEPLVTTVGIDSISTNLDKLRQGQIRGRTLADFIHNNQ